MALLDELDWHGSEEYYDAVIRSYGKMMLKNPRSYVFVSMANTCLKAGKTRMALQVLEKGMKHHPRLASARACKARILIHLNKSHKAREILEEVLREDPKNILARRLMALTCLENGEYREGLEYLEEITKIWPNHQPLKKLYQKLEAGLNKDVYGLDDSEENEREKEEMETEKEYKNPVGILQRWLNNAVKMAVKG